MQIIIGSANRRCRRQFTAFLCNLPYPSALLTSANTYPIRKGFESYCVRLSGCLNEALKDS